MRMKALILFLSVLGAGILLCQSKTPETPIETTKEITGRWVLAETDDKLEFTPHIIEFLSEGKGKAYASYNTGEQTHAFRYSIEKAEKNIILHITFHTFDAERRFLLGHTFYHVSFTNGLLYLKSHMSTMHPGDVGNTKAYKSITYDPHIPHPFKPVPIIPIPIE